MKKAFLIAVFSLFCSVFLFAAEQKSASKPVVKPTPAASTVDSIDEKVKQKMEMIRNAGTTNQKMETEIDVNSLKKTKAADAPADKSPLADDKWTTLGALNIVGGMFEGGIIGTGVGVIGYSQTKNRDITPLVNGAIIGTATGLVLGTALSVYEAKTGKDYLSDDFGFDIGIFTFIGGALGASGGLISYGKTGDLENVSEGAGYGVAIGAFLGLTLGVVESFIPKENRGRLYEGHAMNLEYIENTPVLAYRIEY